MFYYLSVLIDFLRFWISSISNNNKSTCLFSYEEIESWIWFPELTLYKRYNLTLSCVRYLHGVEGLFGKDCCCSVAQSCLILCNPMDCSVTGLPVPSSSPEACQIYVHCVGDAFQPSHLMPFSPSALHLSQHQWLFQWVGRDSGLRN